MGRGLLDIDPYEREVGNGTYPYSDEYHAYLLKRLENVNNSNDSNKVISTIMLFYMHRQQGELLPQERQLLWTAVDNTVKSCERNHYKRLYQTDKNKHYDRVMLFYQLMEDYWYKSPAKLWVLYRKRFHLIEALLEISSYGWSIHSEVVDSNRILYIESKIVYYYVVWKICNREKLTFREYWSKYGNSDVGKTGRLSEYDYYSRIYQYWYDCNVLPLPSDQNG